METSLTRYGSEQKLRKFFVTLSSQSCAHIPNNFMLNWNMAIIIGHSREFLGGLLGYVV